MTTDHSAKKAYDSNREKALKALAEIQKKLRKNLNDPNWADVGSMASVADQLREVSDELNQTGEYA